MSELSQFDDGNVLTHPNNPNRKKRGRRPLDYPDEKNKVVFKFQKKKKIVSKMFVPQFRSLMNAGTPLSASSLVSSAKASTDDSMSDTSG